MAATTRMSTFSGRLSPTFITTRSCKARSSLICRACGSSPISSRKSVPPLRERGEDVEVIARYLLAKYAEELQSKVRGFTPNALIAIRKYDWTGNVRQLENRIKKAIVMCDKTLIGVEDLDMLPEAMSSITTLAQAREDFQRRYILEVLERNNGNRTKTARDLDVDPRTVFRYLEKA